ncbi:immunoglobulin alpha-2 heavy chain-like [Crotalus tigris]|uniref:immunoglobulin alpha-2 heavy chain-like n=1 Tax=Crotalus tigris TaxID=88082 RepID=UPI00192F6C6E|nr:immunoglobulin alpha-2 heavy chain-like [Crotalus tigris]
MLVAFSKGGLSQVALTQSDPVLKKPGESHKLACAVTGFDVNSYTMAFPLFVFPQLGTARSNLRFKEPRQACREPSQVPQPQQTAAGVFSAVQLVESEPGIVRPGSQLNLLCKVTDFSIATSSQYAWHWIRQPNGKGLQWLSAINVNNGGKWYTNSVKSRATISADQSRNEFSLQLNLVIAEDSSVYFCFREHTATYLLFVIREIGSCLAWKTPTCPVFPLSSEKAERTLNGLPWNWTKPLGASLQKA